MFLRPRPALLSQLRRTYATASSPHTLLFIEHQNGEIDSGSLSALNAATQLGGPVTGVIIGGPGQVEPVVEAAKKFKGLTTILHSTSPAYEHPLPEIVSPLLKKIIEQSSTPFTHVVSTHSANSKSLLPRLAATFDVPAISDVTSVSHSSSTGSTTFTRPIYAGNAIATVEAPSDIKPQFFTVRVTAFPKAPEEPGDVKVEKLESIEVNDAATLHLKTTMAKSDRPDLSVASKVVSGGRALKNAETFQKTLDPLADVLGAAVGASRAAVDAGYADNSLQVGQTGKIVAPELYIAVGISGAIQHLAGMKDSKMIVAINKDPEAPIFQVADLGLVADLYEAVPELTEKLKK